MVRKVSIEACFQESRHFSDERFKEGHKFFVSGSGHSHTMAEEMYARAGGLAFVVPIFTMTEHPTKSSHIERLSGYAKILADGTTSRKRTHKIDKF